MRSSSSNYNRHSSRMTTMTPLNMLLAEQAAEFDAARRHSSDSGNANDANEVLTEEQIHAFQEAFALFDKVNFVFLT